MKIRTKKLWKLRRKIIWDHKWSWFFLILSVVLSIITSFVIGYYNAYSFMCDENMYAFSLLINTLSIGYLSAFLYYIFHDFIPQSNNKLEEIQRILKCEYAIYDCSYKLIYIMIEKRSIATLIDICTDKTIEEGKIVLKYKDDFIERIKYHSVFINKYYHLLFILDKEFVPCELIHNIGFIDIYQVISQRIDRKKGSMTIPQEDFENLIKDFERGFKYIKEQREYLEQFRYLTIVED